MTFYTLNQPPPELDSRRALTRLRLDSTRGQNMNKKKQKSKNNRTTTTKKKTGSHFYSPKRRLSQDFLFPSPMIPLNSHFSFSPIRHDSLNNKQVGTAKSSHRERFSGLRPQPTPIKPGQTRKHSRSTIEQLSKSQADAEPTPWRTLVWWGAWVGCLEPCLPGQASNTHTHTHTQHGGMAPQPSSSWRERRFAEPPYPLATLAAVRLQLGVCAKSCEVHRSMGHEAACPCGVGSVCSLPLL